MPIKWTAENDQRLLHLILNEVQVKGDVLLKAWKEKYGIKGRDFSDPTARAIDDHTWKVKTGRTGTAGGEVGVKSTPKPAVAPRAAAPRTPKQRSPKTPASSGKRKRQSMSDDDMSDDDETEPDVSKEALAELPRRTSTPRSSRKSVQTYNEDSGEEENEEEVVGASGDVARTKVSKTGDHGTDGVEDFVNFDGAAEDTALPLTHAAPAKKRVKMDDSDAESDVSNFSATSATFS